MQYSKIHVNKLVTTAGSSDNLTRDIESTRVTVDDFLVTRTLLDSRWKKWWLDSTRVTFFTEGLGSSHSQWLQTRVRGIFTKALSSWWTNPIHLHTKKWPLFALLMILREIFCFACLVVLCCIFKYQVSPTFLEADLRLRFHCGVSRAQYIDTLSWFNVVFAYSWLW